MNHTSNRTPTVQPPPYEWRLPARPDVETPAAGFAPISLQQMEAVALLNRLDAKYLLPAARLPAILDAVRQDYWVLEIHGRRLHSYRTLYFDTPGFDLYHAHVNQRANRYKLRCREYVDTHSAFLEVKHHTPRGRTLKERLPLPRPVIEIQPAARGWLQDVFPFAAGPLEPKLWNTFTRLTLVSRHGCERLTLDLELTFYTAERLTRMTGLVVAEVKRDALNAASPFLVEMRRLRLRPQGFSKYIIGAAMLYDQVKKNAVKPRLHALNKLLGA